ncbi:MAG: hypothetical protein ACLSAH_07755 [Bilophila wadsworthia]
MTKRFAPPARTSTHSGKKLEIDIIQDAKNGIFGLVGRARPLSAPAVHSSSPA